MMSTLRGKRIAILATDGFEQSELLEPRRALLDAGAEVHIVAPHQGEIRGWQQKDWGDKIKVDQTLEQAQGDNYDALFLPGGVMSPDQLRMNEKAVSFVNSFVQNAKPIAAICHGPWTLIETGMVKGRTITSWPSIKTDLQNAGARWVDQEVAVDRGLVTSRRPQDIPNFSIRMIEEFAKAPPLKKAG